jgi:predicted NBD/HSP70 family sugar kinase
MTARTGNRGLMREVNSKLVLGLIRRCEAMSQVELLRKTRLSAGTVASIVKELKGRGFIDEIGLGRSATGRRPVLLQFNPRAQHVAAIELTTDQTRVALVDLAGRIVVKTQRTTAIGVDPRDAIEGACDDALALTREVGFAREKLLGVGISVEGVVDQKQERLVFLANLGWRNVPVKQILESKLGVPAVMNNSGGAIGEYLFGAGQGSKIAVCLEVDSGIGTTVMLNGRMMRGAHGMAGEIGHNLAVPDGNPCSCGKLGCLETVASARAIIAEAVNARRNAPHSLIPSTIQSCPAPEAIRRICEAAASGDLPATSVIENAGRHLGIAAAGLINFLDPELLILTGMVTCESGGALLEVIRRVAAQHVLQDGSRSVRIEQGTLGDDAPLIGAAATVCEQAFRVPVESEL